MTLKVTVKNEQGEPVMGLYVVANDLMNGLTFSRSTDGNGYADVACPGFLPGHRVTLSISDPTMRYQGHVEGDSIQIGAGDQALEYTVPFV